MYEGWLKMDFSAMSEKLANYHKKGSHYIFESEWVPRGDKKVFQSTALFLVQGEDKGIGCHRRRCLRRRLFARSFFPRDAERRYQPQRQRYPNEKNHAVMMLRGKYDSAAMAAIQRMGWRHPEVERTGRCFPGLTLAIKLRGTTLAAIGQRFARISFLTLAALSLVLAVELR